MLMFAMVALIAGGLLPLAHEYIHRRNSTVEISRVILWMTSIHGLWVVSQLLFASCMFATFFLSSLGGTCTLVGLCGISWAVTIWAPYTIISARISPDNRGYLAGLTSDSVDNVNTESEREPEEKAESTNDAEVGPGIVFGLHNAAISGPQIIAAIACSLIFWAVQGTSRDGVEWALRIGGLASCAAAFLAKDLDVGDNT